MVCSAPALVPAEIPATLPDGITPAMHTALHLAYVAHGLHGRARWAARGTLDYCVGAPTVQALIRAKLIKRATHWPNRAHLTAQGRRYAHTHFSRSVSTTPAHEVLDDHETID